MIRYALTWIFSKLPTSDERGQDLIEYAMLGGLIAGAILLVGVLVFSGALTSMATGIGECIDFDGLTTCSVF